MSVLRYTWTGYLICSGYKEIGVAQEGFQVQDDSVHVVKVKLRVKDTIADVLTLRNCADVGYARHDVLHLF